MAVPLRGRPGRIALTIAMSHEMNKNSADEAEPFVQHHPAILRVPPQTRAVPAGYFLEFGGAITRAEWMNSFRWRSRGVGVQKKTAAAVEAPLAPPVNEEYFEWIDLLEAVDQARDRGQFVMVDLGAGYGRWSVHGALAARAAGIEAHCVTVEAEPSHARWMRQHFVDNGLSPADHELLWAAMSPEGGFVPFGIGRARMSYSGEVGKRSEAPYPTAAERRRLRARSALGRPPHVDSELRGSMWVPALTLTDILAPYPIIDLIDLDVQGAEHAVLSAAIRRLNARVRRVHVGTHGGSAGVEDGVRELFTKHRWTCVYDYAAGALVDTPYGRIQFYDGVQSWVNPDVGRPEVAPTAPLHGEEIARLNERVWRLKQRLRVLKSDASKSADEDASD